MHILALFVAVACAWLIYRSYLVAFGLLSKRNMAGARPAALILATTMALALFGANIGMIRPPDEPIGDNIRGDIEDAMLWLRDNTPSPGDPYDISGVPSYGIMTQWDYHGWVSYVGERPVVATLLGTETYGMLESAEFYTAADTAVASDVLDRTRTRYVILPGLPGPEHLAVYLRLVGMEEDRYFRRVSTRLLPQAGYFGLVPVRLYLGDGVGKKFPGGELKPVDGYRLVYESVEQQEVGILPGVYNMIKIFEYVKGVRLRIRAVPGTEIFVSADVTTNTGRKFPYLRSAIADREGHAEVQLSYAPGKDGHSGLGTSYSVKAGSSIVELNVIEDDVINGKVLEMDFK